MNAPDELTRALYQAFVNPPPRNTGFFHVSVDRGGHLAILRGGGLPEPMPVGRTNWCAAFATAVDNGTADGRQVLAMFIDGQPVIVDVMG